jgi:hypothetical protein
VNGEALATCFLNWLPQANLQQEHIMTPAEFAAETTAILAELDQLEDKHLRERIVALFKQLTESVTVDDAKPQPWFLHYFNSDNDVKRLTTVSGLAVVVMGLVAIVAMLCRK